MSDGQRTSRRDLFRVLAGRRPPPAEVPPQARQVAGTFVHLYYVRQDPLAACALAGGAALTRLAAESLLVAQAATTERPRVTSALRRASATADGGASLTYLLRVEPAGGEPFTRHVTVAVELSDGHARIVELVES